MRLWKRSYLAPLVSALICLLVSGGVLVLRARGYLQAAELKAYDVLLNLRKPASAPTAVVIVEVTEPDIRAMARYPMSDRQMAELIENIEKAGPRAVGVDIFRDIEVTEGGLADLLRGLRSWTGVFPGLSVFDGRSGLNRVLTRSTNVVMIWKSGRTDAQRVGPPPVLIDPQHPEYQWPQAGLSDFVTEGGGVVRRGLLYFDNAKDGDEYEMYPSLAWHLANRYLEGAGELKPEPEDPPHLGLWEKIFSRPFRSDDGGYLGADAGGVQFLLDYRGAWSFPHYSVGEINAAMGGGPRRGEIAAALRDKIVLVGYTAVSTKDVFPTSLLPAQHGVVLHGIAAEQLVRLARGSGSLTRVWDKKREGAWTVLWGVLGCVLGLAVRRPLAFTLVAAVALAALAGLVYYAFAGGLWLPFVPPAVAMLVTAAVVTSQAGLIERDNRGALMTLLEKHVSRDVARTIWARRDEFLDGGRLRSQELETATVLFTDLQGFSSMSEQVTAAVLMDWLNEYMEEMSTIVAASGGVVIRFMGDALMAGFGLPVPSTTPEARRRDAAAAVRCGLEMRRAVGRLNARFTAQGRHGVRMRIGVHSGPIVAGSLGGRQRLEYTVLGDTVNTAARLEQYDKSLMAPEIAGDGCRILISESTLALTGGQFNVRGVGELKLHNKEKPVNVFAVLS